MQALLNVLARHWDSQATLKPDRIMAELWEDNPANKSSSDVAAAVARLRRLLESYYATEGDADPVLISLPDRSVRANTTLKDARWIQAKYRAVHDAAKPNVSVETAQPAAIEAAPVAETTLPPRALSLTWIAAGILGLAVLVFTGLMLFPRAQEPNAAQLSGNTMQVVNAAGTVIWSTSFSEGFWPEFYQAGLSTRVWFEDLGDGHKSVLLLYHSAENPQGHSSVLICYSHRGKELWRWTPGRVLPELGNEPAIFIARTLTLIHAADGAPQIVVLSGHFPRYPAQIALLDAHGKTISEYWHSGHLDHMIAADLDGNGRQEIIATGTANGYQEAVLVVLDPDKISGASQETGVARFQLHNLGVAHERFRLLFPRTDLNIATTRYNFAEGITTANGAFRISVQECELNPYCLIWYEFDNRFTLRQIFLDDHFKDAHEAYFLNNPPKHSLTEAELLQLGKVRCLVGCPTDYVPSVVTSVVH